MADLAIDGDELVVTMRGWDAVWALKREVRVPLAAVVAVRPDPVAASKWPDGLRLPGSHLPGVVTAGSYWRPGRPGAWSFWSVRHPRQAIVVDLDAGHYRRLVLEVADPGAAVRLVEDAARTDRRRPVRDA